MAMVNRHITLASRPVGVPRVSDFDLAYSLLPAPAAGEVLVQSTYLSLDPSVRGRMSDVPADARPLAIGELMPGAAVGTVMVSEDPAFQVGDTVEGMLGWQEYTVVRGGELRVVDTGVAPISTALGVLGMPGLTAYFGLLEICAPQPGETVVVSAAGGAVGTVVGQIAKLEGCRVVGVAGADAKISWLCDELGFDAAVNYKATADLHTELAGLCPAGVDVYFDNVGGPISDAVMRLINVGARIAVCGQISQYNLVTPELGPRVLGQLIARQAKVQGFQVSAFSERFPVARAQLARWLEQGQLRYGEDIAEGLEAAPQAFIGMLQGANQGKQLVRLADRTALGS